MNEIRLRSGMKNYRFARIYTYNILRYNNERYVANRISRCRKKSQNTLQKPIPFNMFPTLTHISARFRFQRTDQLQQHG